MSEPQDDLQAKLAQLIAQAEEVRRQIEQAGPPSPEQRRAAFRVIKGALAGIAALAPIAWVRRHAVYAKATAVLAATGVLLSLTPSLSPPVTEVPEPPSIALPDQGFERPPTSLEPLPEPPTPEPAPTPDATAAPAAMQPAPEDGADSEPDTQQLDPPPEEEPELREQPRDEEPPEELPGRACSLIRVELDAVGVCLLPE